MSRPSAAALIILVIFCCRNAAQKDGRPVVTLRHGGQLRGHSDFTTVSGRGIHSFLGVPYAKPPVGELRFQRPAKLDSGDAEDDDGGVLEAVSPTKCAAFDLADPTYSTFAGDEDCLHLNVYVPADVAAAGNEHGGDRDNGLPVMFFLHGGGFFAGDAGPDLYGPDRLLDQGGVILVTANYRLGPLGFLTFGDEFLPSNQGMWDQVAALEWVQENIASFGGDPDRVTLFGESAGANSASQHILSPRSSGLFHRAVLQSGVVTGGAASRDKHPAYYARTLARRVGCHPEAETGEIRDCLLQVSAEDLVLNQRIEMEVDMVPLVWTPVVDGEYDHVSADDAFMPGEPEDLLRAGRFNQVPTVVGSNKDEGLYLVTLYLKDPELVQEANSDLAKTMLAVTMGRSESEITAEERDWAERQLLAGQLQLPQLRLEDREQLLRLVAPAGDATFGAAGSRFARTLAAQSASPVFEYVYDHAGSSSMTDLMLLPVWKLALKAAGRLVGLDLFRTDPPLGVSHFDELMMLFKMRALPYDTVFDDDDHAASDNMVDLWTAFAATGDPTPGDDGAVKWQKLDPANPEWLRIGPELRFGPADPEERARFDFWQETWRRFPPRVNTKRNPSWKKASREYSKEDLVGSSSAEKTEL